MGTPIAVQLPSRTFESKQAAAAFYKDVLNAYSPEQFLTPEDEIAVRELLTLHPEADEKIGVGIKAIKVISAEYGTQCFCAVRFDGTENRFSTKACLGPK